MYDLIAEMNLSRGRHGYRGKKYISVPISRSMSQFQGSGTKQEFALRSIHINTAPLNEQERLRLHTINENVRKILER